MSKSLYFCSSNLYLSISLKFSALNYLFASINFLIVLLRSSRFTSFISWLWIICSRLFIFYFIAFSDVSLSECPSNFAFCFRRFSHSIFYFSITLLRDSTSISSSTTFLFYFIALSFKFSSFLPPVVLPT
jgi:hypothetical protein